MNFLPWIEQSSFVVWLREGGSLWGYPAILFLHTLGLATVAGLSAAISLRVLGFAAQIPLASLTRFFSLIWAAFAVTAASGVLLLTTDATAKLSAAIFYVKMFFVLLALVTVQMLRNRAFRNPPTDSQPVTASVKALSFASIIFWIGAITAGRLMAYISQ